MPLLFANNAFRALVILRDDLVVTLFAKNVFVLKFDKLLILFAFYARIKNFAVFGMLVLA